MPTPAITAAPSATSPINRKLGVSSRFCLGTYGSGVGSVSSVDVGVGVGFGVGEGVGVGDGVEVGDGVSILGGPVSEKQ